jgi:hypothetical protein
MCNPGVIQHVYSLFHRKHENHLLTDYFHEYWVAMNPFNGIGDENYGRVLHEYEGISLRNLSIDIKLYDLDPENRLRIQLTLYSKSKNRQKIFLKRLDKGDIPVVPDEHNHFEKYISQQELDPLLIGLPSVSIVSIYYVGVRLISSAEKYIRHDYMINRNSSVTTSFICGYIRRRPMSEPTNK